MILFKGDINGDGRITLEDCNLCNLYILGKIELTERQLMVADVNSDGVVDTFDSLMILQHLDGTVPLTEYIEV